VNRFFKGVSASVALGLVASLFAASPALAAEEVRFDIGYAGGSYVTITNVVDQKPSVPLIVVEAPSTVTFHGSTLALEEILYYQSAVLADDILTVGDLAAEVVFNVKQYTYFGEDQVYDALVNPAEGPVDYLDGNYATLNYPGYYVIWAAPEAVAPTVIAVQVLDPKGAETAQASTPASASAVPSPSSVRVDGQAVAFEAYNIDGYNYFKLRDLAMALNGSEKQFAVNWDSEKNAINLVTGMAYLPVGGELAVSDRPATQQATPTVSKLYINGAEADITAYNIGGFNYFKLRDIAKAIDCGITWDAETSTIGIDPASSYIE